jgi:hypothetical protein
VQRQTVHLHFSLCILFVQQKSGHEYPCFYLQLGNDVLNLVDCFYQCKIRMGCLQQMKLQMKLQCLQCEFYSNFIYFLYI